MWELPLLPSFPVLVSLSLTLSFLLFCFHPICQSVCLSVINIWLDDWQTKLSLLENKCVNSWINYVSMLFKKQPFFCLSACLNSSWQLITQVGMNTCVQDIVYFLVLKRRNILENLTRSDNWTLTCWVSAVVKRSARKTMNGVGSRVTAAVFSRWLGACAVLPTCIELQRRHNHPPKQTGGKSIDRTAVTRGWRQVESWSTTSARALVNTHAHAYTPGYTLLHPILHHDYVRTWPVGIPGTCRYTIVRDG